MPRLIVIGGIAAGLSAAARARRLDRTLEILVLEKGPIISYGACGLPYWIEGQVQSGDDLIVYSAEEFSRERNIGVRTNSEVVAICHPRREVALKDGERIRYDKLIVATGARPDCSGIAGTDRPHVFTLHTMDDARRMKDFLASAKQPRRAAVVGAGFLGLEVAAALRAQGLSVAMYTRGENLLDRHDSELSKSIKLQLDLLEVDLHTSTTVASIDELRADIVVLATGLKPNVRLAAEAGIELGRTGAIRVSERMETSVWGVYAAGDCAETTHLVTGRPVWIPLGTTANKMGRVAGAAAAGRRETFPGVVGTAILRVCDLDAGMTGLSKSQARREGFQPVSARIESLDRPGYFGGRPIIVELVADRRTRRLLGGTVAGSGGVAGRTGVIAAALTSRMKVDDLEFLDLPYAPPFSPVWDPVLVAAQQLLKALD